MPKKDETVEKKPTSTKSGSLPAGRRGTSSGEKSSKKSKKKVTNTEKAQKETKKATSVQKQKIRVIIRAFDHKIADETAKTIIETAERAGSLVTGPIPMPTKIEKFTINRSTFVNKDAREQFEIRTHKRLIDITEHTPATIESLSNLNLPAGVDLEIKMV